MTKAAARLPAGRRHRVAEQVIEALVAVPLLAVQENVIFHGDPHAGNLLYDNRTGELAIVDWALTERLSREQRRHLALLFLMVSLRDSAYTSDEILALSQHRIRSTSPQGRMIRDAVKRFLDELSPTSLPSGVDAMRLLEHLALKGVTFPGPLVILSKVIFTLDGILGDIGGSGARIGLTLARRVTLRCIRDRAAFRLPLMTGDWITLQCSALLYTSRLWLWAEQALLDRFLPPLYFKAA